MKTNEEMAMVDGENIKFVLSFQGIRGYAILLIFISHCHLIQNTNGDNPLVWLGGLGVEVFIMLSGYLLMMRYGEREIPKTKEYLKKRLKKFYPLHLLTLIGAVPLSLYGFFGSNPLKHWMALFANVLLLQTWVPEHSIYFSFNYVSWYLSLTIFFTIISRFAINLMRRLTWNKVLYLLLAIIVFEFSWCCTFKNSAYAHWLIYILPIVRSLDFLAGGGIYLLQKEVLYRQKYERKRAYWLLAISVLLLIVITMCSLNSQSEFFSVCVWTFPVISLLLSAGLLDHDKKALVFRIIFQNRIVQFIGMISFELFLIHQISIRYVEIIFGRIGLAHSLWMYIGILVLAVFGSVIYKKIEKYVLS